MAGGALAFLSACAGAFLSSPAQAGNEVNADRVAVYKEMERLKQQYRSGEFNPALPYRRGMAELIRSADTVELYIVDFDYKNFVRKPPLGDRSKFIEVPDHGTGPSRFSKVLKAKTLSPAERDEILNTWTDDLVEADQSSGAFCHYPIHAIRAFKAGVCIIEATFCWKCHNYIFPYPKGSDWLDVSGEMIEVFNRILPVPPEEIARFAEKDQSGKKVR